MDPPRGLRNLIKASVWHDDLQRFPFDVYNSRREKLMASESKISLVWGFLRTRKKWWLTPIVVTLILLGVLIVLAESSAVAPFIYALF